MKKTKTVINKTPRDLAKSLGLNSSDAVEWEVRRSVTAISEKKKSGLIEVKVTSDQKDIDLVISVVCSFGADKEQLDSIKEHITNELKGLGRDRTLFILMDSNKAIGAVQLITKKQLEGFIHALQIHKDYQRNGYATKLMTRVEEYAKEIELNKLSLSVDKDNESAIRLYSKLGYGRGSSINSDSKTIFLFKDI